MNTNQKCYKLTLPSMTKGFMQAFDYKECDFIRLNCWPHTERNLKAKVKVVKSAETRSALWKDIHLIQLAHSLQAFQLMCSQFIKKWKSIKDKDINTFIAHMERSWIKKTTTGLRALLRVFRQVTMHLRQPIWTSKIHSHFAKDYQWNNSFLFFSE